MQVLRFVVAGAFNTGITLLVFAGLQHVMPYLLAYSVTYLLGIGLSYMLNLRFVFVAQHSLRSAALYPLVYVVQYLLGAAILWALVERLALAPVPAMIMVVVVTVPITFVLSRAILGRRAT